MAISKKFTKPPLTNLLNRIPQDVLDEPLTDQELVTIAKHVLDWPAKASALGLSPGDVETIREDYKNSHEMQKITMHDEEVGADVWEKGYSKKVFTHIRKAQLENHIY